MYIKHYLLIYMLIPGKSIPTLASKKGAGSYAIIFVSVPMLAVSGEIFLSWNFSPVFLTDFQEPFFTRITNSGRPGFFHHFYYSAGAINRLKNRPDQSKPVQIYLQPGRVFFGGGDPVNLSSETEAFHSNQ
jgi:hypothetical protein